jgi:transmembrane sensor
MGRGPAMAIEEDACLWAARLDRGLSPDEQAVLSAWLAGDDRRRGALLRAQAGLSFLDRGRALAVAAEKARAGIGRRRLIGTAAAAGALFVGVGWNVWPRGQDYSTGVGEIRRIPLEDGSIAIVNSASHMRVAFTEQRRTIELPQGEAWFNVAKDRARPFGVGAGPVRVEAVGTAFSVRRLDDRSEVVVTEGVVTLWHDGSRMPLHVGAGRRAVVGQGGAARVRDLNRREVEQQLAWREGRVVIDSLTLAAAAAEFNRYHRRQLQIDPALAGERMVGWFRTDDLDGFTRASAALVGGRVEQHGDVVRIVQ